MTNKQATSCELRAASKKKLVARSSWLVALTLLCLHAAPQTLPNRRYTTRDGLVADRITVITQDQQGFMWMGSLFGISRYDGTRFTTINLPASQQHKSVTSMLALNSKVYAGFIFAGGLMEYDKGRVTAYSIRPENKGADNDIMTLSYQGNDLLVANGINEVYRFRNKKFERLFRVDSSTTTTSLGMMAADNKGRIWVSTVKGLLLYENGSLTSTGIANGTILFMQNTDKGMMIVRMTEQQRTIVEVFNDKLRATKLWETGYVRQIPFQQNNGNNFWGIDVSRGLFRLTSKGEVDFFASASYVDPEIKYLFADRESNVWMATDPGVLKVSNVPAVSYEFSELAPGGGDVVRAKDSNTWCNNAKYLYQVKNSRLVKMPEFRHGGNMGYLGAMKLDENNNLWICGWDRGIWKLRYKNDKLVENQFTDSYQNKTVIVNCLTGDGEGNVWAAGTTGIFHIRNGQIAGHFVLLGKQGGPAFITAITIDTKRKELWLGENTSGLIHLSYMPNKNSFDYKVLNYFGAKDGLTDTYVRSVEFDSKDNLWIGTRIGGIFRMKKKQDGNYQVQHYGSENGINCTRVTDIAEEKGTAVWFATCDGIFRFSHDSETWQSYNVSDGLPGAEIFSISPDAAAKHVWAISGQGLTDMHYGMGTTAPAPQINITQVSVLGQEDTSALLLNRPMKLSASESSISFVFAGTSYTDEKKIRYKYMLEGYDKGWSPPVQSNNVNYASLPFGNYTFKVMASNGKNWSEQPAIFSFQVIRPFYKSIWFSALIACLLALSFYFIRIYRLKQKLKLEKLRVNIARDLHDDIGSALGSINLLSENATRRLATTKSVEEVEGVFKKIGYSAQSMLDSMDDIIWTINPEKDSLEDLLIRMREFAIPLLEAKNIAFDINMNSADVVKPSMEIKRNIYLVFKEAIFNIVRHSGARQVNIKASFTSRSYHLSIEDNGKGFLPNTASSRNGLKNMKKRADLSDAQLDIRSAPGEGTTIHLHGIIR
jgi:ligand-binding sensor domain-containing protein/two-component sensor histidine kinase